MRSGDGTKDFDLKFLFQIEAQLLSQGCQSTHICHCCFLGLEAAKACFSYLGSPQIMV